MTYIKGWGWKKWNWTWTESSHENTNRQIILSNVNHQVNYLKHEYQQIDDDGNDDEDDKDEEGNEICQKSSQ